MDVQIFWISASALFIRTAKTLGTRAQGIAVSGELLVTCSVL